MIITKELTNQAAEAFRKKHKLSQTEYEEVNASVNRVENSKEHRWDNGTYWRCPKCCHSKDNCGKNASSSCWRPKLCGF